MCPKGARDTTAFAAAASLRTPPTRRATLWCQSINNQDLGCNRSRNTPPGRNARFDRGRRSGRAGRQFGGGDDKTSRARCHAAHATLGTLQCALPRSRQVKSLIASPAKQRQAASQRPSIDRPHVFYKQQVRRGARVQQRPRRVLVCSCCCSILLVVLARSNRGGGRAWRPSSSCLGWFDLGSTRRSIDRKSNWTLTQIDRSTDPVKQQNRQQAALRGLSCHRPLLVTASSVLRREARDSQRSKRATATATLHKHVLGQQGSSSTLGPGPWNRPLSLSIQQAPNHGRSPPHLRVGSEGAPRRRPPSPITQQQQRQHGNGLGLPALPERGRRPPGACVRVL